jgi:hypothetical protein
MFDSIDIQAPTATSSIESMHRFQQELHEFQGKQDQHVKKLKKVFSLPKMNSNK